MLPGLTRIACEVIVERGLDGFGYNRLLRVGYAAFVDQGAFYARYWRA